MPGEGGELTKDPGTHEPVDHRFRTDLPELLQGIAVQRSSDRAEWELIGTFVSTIECAKRFRR